MSILEILGFITGAASVWLAAKENILNWPIGILNSISFLLLFVIEVKLYGSAGIQVFYILLGSYGWYNWLYGGTKQSQLKISRLSANTLTSLIVLTAIATCLMTWLFTQTNDPAPFLDAFTTAMSLAATYLLTIKVLENWYVWIATDVIFIILYASQELFLTSFLYGIFLLMCLYGLRDWRSTWNTLKELEKGSITT